MATNIDLDEALVESALRLTGERTKRAVVHRALQELIRVEQLRALAGARGSMKWEANLAQLREERAAPGPARRHKRVGRGSSVASKR